MTSLLSRSCSIEGCHGAMRRRGWCERHYRRWQRYGDPLAGAVRHTRRFPLEPLERLVAATQRPVVDPQGHHLDPFQYFATTLDYDRQQVRRWRDGGIPEQHADRMAQHLGEHPGAVWASWWDDIDQEETA